MAGNEGCLGEACQPLWEYFSLKIDSCECVMSRNADGGQEKGFGFGLQRFPFLNDTVESGLQDSVPHTPSPCRESLICH